MRILGIDTSTAVGSIAIYEKDGVEKEISYHTKAGHAEVLVNKIDELLKSVGLDIKDIDGFAVGLGPGSFTGLRIGLATAKGLALSTNKPLVGISSLYSLFLLASTLQHLNTPTLLIPCIDAYRSEVYCFINNEEMSVTPDRLCEMLSKLKGDFLFAGDGAERYKDIFKTHLKDRFSVVKGNPIYPSALIVAREGAKEFAKGKSDNLETLIPNYIRKSDAEIKLRGRVGKLSASRGFPLLN